MIFDEEVERFKLIILYGNCCGSYISVWGKFISPAAWVTVIAQFHVPRVWSKGDASP